MVLIVAGLLTAGIVAFEKRQNHRDARKRNSSNEEQQQSLTDQQDGYSKVTQAQIDEQAFQEVQNYADFQRSLSKRVHDDILKEGSASNPGYPGPSLSHTDLFRDYFSKELYRDPALDPALFAQTARGHLPSPIVIPQRISEDTERCWAKAYAPSLSQSGIDQDCFLDFIDSFNEATRISPHLAVVNVAALVPSLGQGLMQVRVSVAVPTAIDIAKRLQLDNDTNSFLRRANDELFAVHGLFAMVIAFNEKQNLQSYTVNTSQPSRDPSLLTQPQLQLGAPLIFPEVDIGHHSKRPRTPKRHRRQTSSSTASPSKRRVIMNNTFEGAFADRTRTKKQSFSGAMRGMMSGPGKAERDFMKRINTKEIDEDALYLMIVNNPPGGDPSMVSGPNFIPRPQEGNPWSGMPQTQHWGPASDEKFPRADSSRSYSDHMMQEMGNPPPAYQGADENEHQWM